MDSGESMLGRGYEGFGCRHLSWRHADPLEPRGLWEGKASKKHPCFLAGAGCASRCRAPPAVS
eukprot:6624352-Pyramimonas_sp.AAC.1